MIIDFNIAIGEQNISGSIVSDDEVFISGSRAKREKALLKLIIKNIDSIEIEERESE